jgi:hypothetical protein
LEYFYTKCPSIPIHFFHLYTSRAKLFVEVTELFIHTAFQLVTGKKVSSECILQGAKKMEIGGCYTGTVGRTRENKFQVQSSVGKVMASIFCVTEGIFLLEILYTGATINSEPLCAGIK